MSWKFLAGASILTAGLLLKMGAPPAPIVLGIAAAACLQWRRQRTREGKPRGWR